MNTRMWTRICMLAIALALVVVAAADVNGKWRAEFATPDGTQRVNTFTFKMDGDKLTGTVAGARTKRPSRTGR